MKGQVKSESGEPLIGVTVYGANGKVSGVTDMDGMYHIDIPTSLTVVRFSYVGMNPVSITIEPGTTAVVRNLSMQSSTTIKDIVVTGIFQKNKEAFTGAVATITNKELKEFGNKNLLTSIANIDPSFNLLANNQYGSDPNHLPDVQIRGTANLPTLTNLQDNTRTDLNTPLIILDGFEISLARMVDLNEDEVESITLLKDGSATAIYGSRGANGVIVIKRKTPQTGRLRFSYNYAPVKPDMPGRHNGVLISQEQGEAVAYALWNLEDRGRMFVSPNDKIYEGMIIGIHSRDNDLVVNPLKGKKLTNIRASGTDEAVRLTTPIKLTLEGAVEFIDDDELVEITPQSIRLRKRYLSELERRRHFKKLD